MPFDSRFGEPSTDIQIWHCDPLVVVHPTDGVVYAERTDAEYQPKPGEFGFVRALTPGKEELLPVLTITDWYELTDTVMLPYRLRPGRILFGHDEEGTEFTWYLDRAADEYLTHGETAPTPVDEEVLESP